MKRIFLVLLLALSGCIHPYAFDREIAGRPLPGHWVRNHCEEYADNLVTALRARGIPAAKLIYDWRAGRTEKRHAIVVFRHNGKLLGMDNGKQQPVNLTGATTDLEAAGRFDPSAFQVVDRLTLEPKQAALLNL